MLFLACSADATHCCGRVCVGEKGVKIFSVCVCVCVCDFSHCH